MNCMLNTQSEIYNMKYDVIINKYIKTIKGIKTQKLFFEGRLLKIFLFI